MSALRRLLLLGKKPQKPIATNIDHFMTLEQLRIPYRMETSLESAVHAINRCRQHAGEPEPTKAQKIDAIRSARFFLDEAEAEILESKNPEPTK